MFSRIAILVFAMLVGTACSGGSTNPNNPNPNTNTGGGSGGSGAASNGASNITASSSSSSTGTSSAASSASSTVSTSVVWTSVPPSPGQITAVSSDGVIAANSVITFGQTFQQGEMPIGVTATSGSTPLLTQTDVKRRHPDGSIRHAVVSVRLPAASAPVSFSLSAAGSALAGTSVTLAQALASSVDYRVEIAEMGATPEAGKTWSTTLKQALGASPSQWISGPLVTEWRSRVAPINGSLSHPGLRVLFDARYQGPTQGRVSIAIENVEATAARGDRTYNLRIYDSSNAVVYSVDSLLHYAQTRHRKILYFGAGVKEMMAIVDIERLKNARAIPNYSTSAISPATLDYNYTFWQASARGIFEKSITTAYMAMTGGRADIGPLPGWTAMALMSRDPRMYQVMFDQAERAGYYGVHYRDPATSDIYNINTRPTFSLYVWYGHSPYSGGDESIAVADRLPPPVLPATTPAGWQQDTDHEPSLTYLPYVITGDQYYLDELYFWADYHFIQQNAAYRNNAEGLVNTFQTRGQAWTMRTLGHAAWISPDGDWRKDYFTTKLNNNIAWYRANVLTSNTLGIWSGWVDPRSDNVPYGSNQIGKVFGPWQHNFMAFTLGELYDRGYDVADLRDFALGFSTKLFTSDPAYNRYDGTAYYLPVQLTDNTVISSMSALSYHAFANRTSGAPTALDISYAVQALAGLSAAVDAGVPNASAGYVFVRNDIMQRGWSTQVAVASDPTWNIVPRGSVAGLSEAPGLYVR